jgi:ketosteroid isomerase-like protein
MRHLLLFPALLLILGGPALIPAGPHDERAAAPQAWAAGATQPSLGGTPMPITPEDVADAVRQWCMAWHTRDIPTILAMEAQAGGFGFRRVDRRDHVTIGEAPYRKTLEQFFGRMEDYRLEPEDIQTAVTGAVGLAWGVYLETFREQGRPPERARVRFSKVLTKGPQGWQVLLYHRDIQPFTDDGRYPRTLTGVSPTP